MIFLIDQTESQGHDSSGTGEGTTEPGVGPKKGLTNHERWSRGGVKKAENFNNYSGGCRKGEYLLM